MFTHSIKESLRKTTRLGNKSIWELSYMISIQSTPSPQKIGTFNKICSQIVSIFSKKELPISRFYSWDHSQRKGQVNCTFNRAIQQFLNSFIFEKITVVKWDIISVLCKPRQMMCRSALAMCKGSDYWVDSSRILW